MSSILRALRRLEAEARSEEEDEPSLHEHVVFSGSRGRGSRNVFALAALVVVVVCVGAIGIAGVRLLTGAPRDAQAPPLRSADADDAMGSAGGRFGASAARSATTRPAPTPRAAPSPAADAVPFAAEAPRPARRVAAVVPPPTRRVPVAAVEAPPPPRVPAAAPMAKTAPRAGGTASAPIKTAAAPSVPTPVAADGGAETVVDAPGSSGAPVGVERILWHPSAEKRRAWLRVDGEETAREVREGEQVGRYAVTRIDAGSVLFRSGSTELTRKLGAGLP